jgi:hypothetical protein
MRSDDAVTLSGLLLGLNFIEIELSLQVRACVWSFASGGLPFGGR